MRREQISMFQKDEKEISEKKAQPKHLPRVSDDIFSAFSIAVIPFINCDFDSVYPQIASILPKEKVTFCSFPIDTFIRCEIICAGICHQMNWDFLRNAIYEKTIHNPDWLRNSELKNISSEEIKDLLKLYPKAERIRGEERASLVRLIGEWLDGFDTAESIFTNKDGNILTKRIIRDHLLSCKVFSNDPEEKKIQLLLQKLSSYNQFSSLKKYCEPAIDYHLIRCYLRRGLLYTSTRKGFKYVNNEQAKRRESTVAAIRQKCSNLLKDISEYTGIDILTINQIEWHIGRSICIQGTPDCFLQNDNSSWLKPFFSKCPFINTCRARLSNNEELLNIKEPTYLGSSY